jgi:cyclophilin family peptidyl-prolyl cis-trans isomerase
MGWDAEMIRVGEHRDGGCADRSRRCPSPARIPEDELGGGHLQSGGRPEMRLTARFERWALACTLSAFSIALSIGLATGEPIQAADDAEKKGGGKPVVILSTSQGDIKVELDAEKAPITVENFLRYVDDGFFDGTIFHRVIPGFMIQCGGFDREMVQKDTREAIKNEADNGLSNDRGSLAMARTSEVNSATSQFFINLKDNDFLNHGSRDFGYAVFGRVVDGMEVVNRKGHGDVPVEPIVINSASRE